ncbi:hypothetical protein Vi05172_g11353 [Venturia inaequalis]|nr:hypothetical protein Vi05172_g11353 [Venturia inaequalis]
MIQQFNFSSFNILVDPRIDCAAVLMPPGALRQFYHNANPCSCCAKEKPDGPHIPKIATESTEEATRARHEELMADSKAWFAKNDYDVKDVVFMNREEVESIAQSRSESIIANWNLLRRVLSTHEEVIRRRWMKKTRKQRQMILRQAFPRISKEHNPCFSAVMIGRARGQLPVECMSEESIYWPYLNLDDLSLPKPFLLILNARGRNSPECFATADFSSLSFGLVFQALPHLYLYGYHMNFNSQREPARYAILTPATPHDIGKDFSRLNSTVPGEGLHVLKVQEKTMEFLLAMSGIILHDVQGLLSSVSQSPGLPEPPSLLLSFDQTVGEMPSLSDIAAEAVYRMPTATNLAVLGELITARVEAAIDHIWSLHQDPGYLTDTARQLSLHCKDYDFDGKYFYRPEKPLPAWSAIRWAICIAIANVDKWCQIQRRFQTVLSLKGDTGDDVVNHDLHDWPRPYVEALVILSMILNEATLIELLVLRDAVYCSPLTRHFWEEDEMERVPKAIRNSRVSFLTPKQDYKVPDDLLMALFSLLTMAGHIQERPIRQEIEHIDRILSSDSNQRAKIAPFTLDILANVQVLQEIQYQLVQYCPWLVHHGEMRKEFAGHIELRTQDSNLYKNKDKLIRVTSVICGLPLREIEHPAYALFDYPADKRRTAQNVTQMQLAEDNLDGMWAKMNSGIQAILGGESLAEFLPALNFAGRVLQRTPDFVMQIPPTITVDQPSSAELSTHLQQVAATINSDFSPAQKIKLKTRGANTTDPVQETEESKAQDDQTASKQVFSLKARDHKVFRALFYQPSQDTTLGQIKWYDFLHAMISVGFTAQKLGGSAWQFTPTTAGYERCISFHEPHPDSKISFWVGRHMGGRLTRAYGWDRETFTLTE